MTEITISELRIHPVKAFKRTLLEAMDIIRTGPLHDRQFMLIDENNVFLTQRTHPLMATVDVKIDDETLTLLIPGYDPIVFGLKDKQGDSMDAIIWKDTVRVIEPSPLASVVLSQYFDIPCQLVIMAPNDKRILPPKDSKSGVDEVLFPDGFPFLLISQPSLDDLNTRLEVPVPMDRFRPNIVVSGCAPYEEDSWEVIQIGDIIFDLLKACARCTVTTVDQETGLRDKEKGTNPLKALAQYRNTEKGILFGQNMIHRSMGTISVGDSVRVLKWRENV